MKNRIIITAVFAMMLAGCHSAAVKKADEAAVRRTVSEKVAEVYQKRTVERITRNISFGISEQQLEQIRHEN